MKLERIRTEEFFEFYEDRYNVMGEQICTTYARVTTPDSDANWYIYISDPYEPASYMGVEQSLEEKFEAEYRMQVKELSKVLRIIA